MWRVWNPLSCSVETGCNYARLRATGLRGPATPRHNLAQTLEHLTPDDTVYHRERWCRSSSKLSTVHPKRAEKSAIISRDAVTDRPIIHQLNPQSTYTGGHFCRLHHFQVRSTLFLQTFRRCNNFFGVGYLVILWSGVACVAMASFSGLEICWERGRRPFRSVHWLPVFALTVILANLPTSSSQVSRRTLKLLRVLFLKYRIWIFTCSIYLFFLSHWI